MSNLTTDENQRRIRIVTQRSAFTLAFLSCLLVHQIMVWAGAVKPDESLGTVFMKKPHWYLISGLLGAIIGACLGYFVFTSWLASSRTRRGIK